MAVSAAAVAKAAAMLLTNEKARKVWAGFWWQSFHQSFF